MVRANQRGNLEVILIKIEEFRNIGKVDTLISM